MTTPELTLNEVRKSPKLISGVPRVSDFLTKEQKKAREKRKQAHQKTKRIFDEVDAYIAEIIARFGYETYEKWNAGEISEEKMAKLIAAERAREKAYLLPFETLVAQLLKDCIRRSKKDKKPTGPKEAAKILKDEAKKAMGERL